MLVKNPVCLQVENGFITKVYSQGQSPDSLPEKNSEAKKLLETGFTDKLKFISKQGKEFESRLKLDKDNNTFYK